MKLSQNLRPKLQQAIDHQKYLYENFNRIKQDTELLPMIFRAEAAVRTKALNAQQQAEEAAKEALGKMEKKKRKIENLKKDKAKALQVAARTMAAHTNIKSYLDLEKERN